MIVNRRQRKFHSPWGRSDHDSVIREQYRVGAATTFLNRYHIALDITKAIEATDSKYVFSKKGVEKIRR